MADERDPHTSERAPSPGATGDEPSDAERIRELEETIDARDRFLSLVAHDLKTPLSAMQLHAQMLLRGARKPEALPTEKLVTKLEAIRRQIGRLSGLIDDMLDITRITRGRVDMTPVDTDFRDAVREVIEGRDAAIRDSGSDVALSAPAPVPGRWDPARLRQIASHLLDNALQYAPGRIEVSLHLEGERARLDVSDEGPGVAPEEQAHIFAAFARGHQAGDDRIGLGLWVVDEVARAMGGAVALDSAPGRGARFSVDLPASPQVP